VTELTWSAAMISPIDDFAGAPILWLDFDLDEGHGDIRSAVLHVSSLGVFEASLNGAPVSDDVLSPGWSSYEWRLRYRSYDVRTQLAEQNTLEVLLGNGWYRGRLGWSGSRSLYGPRLGLIVQLEVTFADRHRQVIATDDQWRARPSDTTENDLYDGQTIDARRRDTTGGTSTVEAIDFDLSRLTPYLGPPVRRHEALRPVRIWQSPTGRTLVDFGQNLVGWLRLRAKGERGTTVTMRHAEVLEHEELGVRPLRTAVATDRFVLSGNDDEFEPTLTFHGFRYAEVEGYPGELTADDIEAVVVHSDLRRTGWFECSDDLLNQLHRNVVWSLRGNFLDIPTDCPQRDERLGWTGDLAVFVPTAAFLYDIQSFLQDWLLDLWAEQQAADGVVPFVVPDILKFGEGREGIGGTPTAVWSDVAVWAPWALWQSSGDAAVLEQCYPSMAAHVRKAAAMLSPTGLWDNGFQFGDWLDPDAPPDAPWKAKADRRLVAQMCLYRSTIMTAEAAHLTGHADEAEELEELATRLRDAFQTHYLQDDGRLRSDAVTAYALAITFGLLDPGTQDLAGERLAELVAENGYRIATGFAGTPFVTDALTTTGHVDVAYRLLLEQGCPSWLYPVTMGATTIWERWDSMLSDGSINPGEMTSFNHYALGAVADWMHRTIGGLAPLEPGYRRVRIAPRPGGGLTWAKTNLDSRHGRIHVSWRLDGDELTVTGELPEGVTGTLDLDRQPPIELESGPFERRGTF
jgi:alpha-L-rhamnosidase